MRIRLSPSAPCAGNTLVMVVVTGGIMGITVASMLALSGFSLNSAHDRADWNAAFYHAENSLEWAAQCIADSAPTSSNLFATANGSLTLPYAAQEKADPTSGFKNAWVKVVRTNSTLQNTYLVTSSARVNDKVRTLQAVILKSPPSEIFDYEYFLNNWGWWWGASITGHGGNRANWDFDFRQNPTVNGLILANGNITQNGVPVNQLTNNTPFGGLAGSDPVALAHSGVPRLAMPNLKDLSHYQSKALANPATNGIWVGSTQVVAGVHSDAKPGLYLVGTDTAPIRVSGTAVIPGDVIIKGKITGQGTLYVGGNLYVAGDMTYKNGPGFASPPETMTSVQRDQWVQNNKTKDLVAFAVTGSILGGDVTSSDWKRYCYDPVEYGLSTVGDETKLGADGILHTPDDGIAYQHADGTFSSGYDADGDGVIQGNYSYTSDLNMTSTRINKIKSYPVNSSGTPLSYSSVASNTMGLLDAIFYTNHAVAMRLAKSSAVFHGVVISRNEAIVYNGSCAFVYDSRVHSRYNNDPNRFVDLGLPVAGLVRIDNFAEIPADCTNL